MSIFTISVFYVLECGNNVGTVTVSCNATHFAKRNITWHIFNICSTNPPVHKNVRALEWSIIITVPWSVTFIGTNLWFSLWWYKRHTLSQYKLVGFLEINWYEPFDIPGERSVFLINQSYKQQQIHVNECISVHGGLINACIGLIWFWINVADSYGHHEKGVGKR